MHHDDPDRSVIDESFISDLVDRFYGRVREDPELGPIFEGAIGDHWEPHLERMKRFWSAVILRTGDYSGRPVPAHQRLSSVVPAHFQRWLGLFRDTLAELSSDPAVVSTFMERADRIANSLQLAMFGRAGVVPKKTLSVL